MIDPIAFKIGPLAVHWYGIAYGVGLIVGMWILWQLNKKRKVLKNIEQLYDLAFWVFLFGVVLGGRLGYVLFYNLPYFIQNPAKIIAIWEGGMSFHGGLIASLIVGYFYCKKQKIDYLALADLAVIPGALALTFSRLANFVNRELVGRIVESPKWQWLGVDFGDGLFRYPSQLFQSVSALILFLILLFIFSKKPRRGILLFSYLALYGLFRTTTELWRAPDPQIGFIWKVLTLGQIFSLLMLAIGLIGLFYFRKR